MLTPQSEEELAGILRDADGPLAVKGGGTRGVQAAGVGVSSAGLSGIVLHEPGALTLVARAGTPVAEVETVLAKAGQRLAFEPMDHRVLLGGEGVPTIGGVVAANVSGPRRIQAGACRDSLIGVRFVDGTGAIVKNGGRVMKNVTGYDLVKLMAGSFGTLGVLSEVSFKVLPASEAAATVALPDMSPAAAVRALGAALGSPFDVSGAAWAGGRALVRLEGFCDSVAYRAGRIRDVWADMGPVEIEDDAAQVSRDWREIRDVAGFAGRPGDVWRVSVRPTDGPVLLQQVGADDALMDWGGGLVWLLVPEGTDVRALMGGLGGHATLVRGSAATRARTPVFHPEPPVIAGLTAGLRSRFDPRGILNPGLMG